MAKSNSRNDLFHSLPCNVTRSVVALRRRKGYHFYEQVFLATGGRPTQKEDLSGTMAGMAGGAALEKKGTNLLPSARLPRMPLLTIAGFDPSSGAGVTADLQTFWNHGLDGISAITALTVQSTAGVRAVEPLPADLLRRTLECLAEDHPPAGVKIGMLATAELVREVAAFLRRSAVPRERVVLDPVLRSTSGAELLDREGVDALRTDLLPQVGWMTPNLNELAALTGVAIPDRSGIPPLARKLAALASGVNVVVTGGHLDPPDDFLLTADGTEQWFPGRRVEAQGLHGTHGTGCAFSSALLSRLTLGDSPADAVAGAKACVVRRLAGETLHQSPGGRR